MQACLKALPHTVPGQRVNCIPGISALTDKRRLIETLVRAYGEGAFRIVPRTFLLPEQYLGVARMDTSACGASILLSISRAPMLALAGGCLVWPCHSQMMVNPATMSQAQ